MFSACTATKPSATILYLVSYTNQLSKTNPETNLTKGRLSHCFRITFKDFKSKCICFHYDESIALDFKHVLFKFSAANGIVDLALTNAPASSHSTRPGLTRITAYFDSNTFFETTTTKLVEFYVLFFILGTYFSWKRYTFQKHSLYRNVVYGLRSLLYKTSNHNAISSRIVRTQPHCQRSSSALPTFAMQPTEKTTPSPFLKHLYYSASVHTFSNTLIQLSKKPAIITTANALLNCIHINIIFVFSTIIVGF